MPYKSSSRLPEVVRGTLLSVLALALAVGAGGCCGSPERGTLVLLLAGDGDSVGKVSVSTPAGTQILDEAGEATRAADPEAAPSEPALMSSEEVEAIFGRALEAQPMRPAVFILYFKPASDDLDDDSIALLPDIIDAVNARDSVDTSVVGHTDTVGTREFNYRLSTKRAVKVRDILAEKGVDPAILHVTSHGEANPLVPTADETEEPRNRRVEVTVR